MSAVAAPAGRERRPVLLLQGALSLVFVVTSADLLLHWRDAAVLRALGLPSWLHLVIAGAELLGVALLWWARTALAAGWLLGALIVSVGTVHTLAGRFPLEFVLYLAVVYALVRLRPRPV